MREPSHSRRGRKNRSRENARSSRAISRSRATLATIEAAAIDSDSASPSMIARAGQAQRVGHVAAVDQREIGAHATGRRPRAPSRATSRRGCCSGRSPRRWRRRRRPTARSPESAGTAPRAARGRASSNRRCPRGGCASGAKITAATPTGPASGPRPTSSTPATNRAPSSQLLALEREIRAGASFAPAGPACRRARSNASTSRSRSMKARAA